VLRYIIRRLIQIIPTLFGVSVAIFLFVRAIPGNPAVVMAGLNANAAAIHALTIQYGLNRPIPVQYLLFLRHAFTGNFGTSIQNGAPVISVIAFHLMPTVELALFGLGVAVVIGVSAGVFSAVSPNSRLDYSAMTLAMMGISFPPFWLAMGLVAVFAVGLNWLPSGGNGSAAAFILPAISLGLPAAASVARFTRQSMLGAMVSDYVRTARSKGIAEASVILKHALKNALGPVLTIIGLQFGFLLGGVVVIEVVFAWPGLGSLLVNSVEARDYPVIQALMLLFALEFVLASLIVDIAYAFVDPQVTYD